MNQFERALERIKVIKGVSCGSVSTADIEAIAAKMGIEESSMSDLYCFFKRMGLKFTPKKT